MMGLRLRREEKKGEEKKQSLTPPEKTEPKTESAASAPSALKRAQGVVPLKHRALLDWEEDVAGYQPTRFAEPSAGSGSNLTARGFVPSAVLGGSARTHRSWWTTFHHLSSCQSSRASLTQIARNAMARV